MRGRGVALAVLAATVVVGAVALRPSQTGSPVHPASPAKPPVTVTVLAAASLAQAFTRLAAEVERDNAGVTVRLSFGASSTLAAQVAAGAPADVIATADDRTMQLALEGVPGAQDTAVRSVVFARNTLAMAVPGANPGGVSSLSSLDNPAITFAVCAPEVPCGAAAARVLAAAGISHLPVTYEKDATAVLTKVRSAEVDAGLVYASDVRPNAPGVLDGSVRAVAIPPGVNTTNAYPVAVLPSGHTAQAQAFVDALLSAHGRQVLADAGFLAP